MYKRILSISLLILFSVASCKGKSDKQKQQMIEHSILEMKVEMQSDTMLQKKAQKEDRTLEDKISSRLIQKSKGDSIIGVWEVKNNYYMAIYEIVKYEKQYLGKVHYYNDGENEIKTKGSKEDYFLEGIYYRGGKYTQGKMHTPDNKQYDVILTLKGDELVVEMKIEGHPYSESWKRMKLEQVKK